MCLTERMYQIGSKVTTLQWNFKLNGVRNTTCYNLNGISPMFCSDIIDFKQILRDLRAKKQRKYPHQLLHE